MLLFPSVPRASKIPFLLRDNHGMLQATISAPTRAHVHPARLDWWWKLSSNSQLSTSPSCGQGCFFFSPALYVDGISNSSKVIHDPATTAELFVYSQQMGLVSVSQITF